MTRAPRTTRALTALALATVCAGLLGCDDINNMIKQAKITPLAASDVFQDGKAARTPPEGTVPYLAPPAVPTPAERPIQINSAILASGRERFNIDCSPCHGYDGYGQGMIVQRGYPQPPSLHEQRLRDVSDQYIFEVITHGRGKMPPKGFMIPPQTRREIIAYVRALQLSQHMPVDRLPAAERSKVASGPPISTQPIVRGQPASQPTPQTEEGRP